MWQADYLLKEKNIWRDYSLAIEVGAQYGLQGTFDLKSCVVAVFLNE